MKYENIKQVDISAYFRFFFVVCLTFLHIRGFYTNVYIEKLFSIPFLGNMCLTSYSNYIFFTLSGFYIEKKYGQWGGEQESTFLLSHYAKLFKMSLITLPVALWFHYNYYHDDINIFNIVLDIFLFRTGYITGNINPYNQPLWFINILFLVYFVYYVEHILLIFVLAAMQNGVFSIPVADGRIYWALMSFYSGIVLHDIEKILAKRKAVEIATILICILIICRFAYEIIIYNGVSNVYPSGFREIAIQVLLWCPLTWICSHIVIKNATVIIFTKYIEKTASSLFIWHWPMINIIGNILRIFHYDSTQLSYTVLQILILIVVSFISAVWLEPKFSKLFDFTVDKIFIKGSRNRI